MLHLLLSLTVIFAPLPIALPDHQPPLSSATSWKLYTWNADWSVYCECSLEHESHAVAVVLNGDTATFELPASVKPGRRYLALVPVFYGGAREGSTAVLQFMDIPKPAEK